MEAFVQQEDRLGPATCFDPELALVKLLPMGRSQGDLGLAHALAVAQRYREALLSVSNGLSNRVQALLSGHGPNGGPLQGPHLAIVPLASGAADGRLAGLALALPRSMKGDERRQLLRAAGRIHRLLLGRLGAWQLARWHGHEVCAWLAPREGAVRWATVTPFVHDAHPKATREPELQAEIRDLVTRSCAHVGLLPPEEITATPVSAHSGMPRTNEFPPLRRKDGHPRRHTHLTLTFDRPVQGPVLLGAGRYRGYGVFRPLPGAEEPAR